MADRLIARNGLSYAADAASQALIDAAGGRSKLSPEDRAKVRIKRVEPGEPCDDVPANAVDRLIASGDIERVPAKPAKGKK